MAIAVNGLDEIKTLAGRDLGQTGWMKITQQRVNTFADATDDHQWIHVDTAKAANGPFGQTIAHGLLTLSLAIPLYSELLEIGGISMAVNYGLNRVRFPAPVPVGSRIRLGARVVSVDDAGPNSVQVVVDLTVEAEGGGKPACVAQAVHRYYA